MHNWLEARRKPAVQVHGLTTSRQLRELEELAQPVSAYANKLPWKRRLQGRRYLAKDFGNDNTEAAMQ